MCHCNFVAVCERFIRCLLPEKSKFTGGYLIDNQLLIIIGASAGALVMILIIVVLLVNRHHRHKNKKLVMALSEKT